MLSRNVLHPKPPAATSYIVPAVPRFIASRRYASRDFTAQPSPDFSQVSKRVSPNLRNNPTKLMDELGLRLPTFHEQLLRTPSDSQADVFNGIISEARAAMASKDIDNVWQSWTSLREKHFMRFLGPSHYDVFSRFVYAVCGDWSEKTIWTEKQERALEDLGLSCAVGGAADGLKAYMVVWIKRKDPATVLRLYRRYVALLNQKHGWKDKEKNVVSPNSGADNASVPPSVHSDILLAAVTAHAMQGTFTDALTMSLETSTRFPSQNIGTFANDLQHDSALQAKVKEYVRHLETARLVARPPSLFKQLSNLSRDLAVGSLERLYNAIMEGFTGPYVWLTVNPDDVVPSRKVLLPEQAWASFILAFQRCHRKDLVQRLWNDMSTVGVRPGVTAWTALIDGYAEQRNADEAIKSWNAMLTNGISPDPTTHRAIISALFTGERPEEALRRFKAFQAWLVEMKAPLDDPRVLLVYNTTLHGLFSHNEEAEALSLFEQMRTRDPKADIVTFNTALRYYGRRGNMKMLATVLQQLEADGVKGDAFTFSTVLTALMKIREDAPQIMLNLMKKQGIKPSVATLSVIIDNQMKSGTVQGLKAAMSLLDRMERSDGDGQPNEVTYTSVLSGILQADWLDRQVADDHRKNIMERMRRRGIRPSKATYNILLKASLENPSPDGVQNAMRYYRDIQSRKLFVNNDTWYIILHGLIDREEWGLANEVAQDFHRGGYRPSGALLDLLHRVRRGVDNRTKAG